MNKLLNAPDDIKNIIINDFNQFPHLEPIIYTLNMVWIARKDKMNAESFKAYVWVTENYLSEDQAQLFKMRQTQIFSPQNSQQLKHDIIHALHKDFLDLTTKPKDEKTSFFKRFFK